MDRVYHTKLGEGHRLAIPAELCKQLGLVTGTPLAIKVRDDGLQVVPYEQIIREVQEAFAPYQQPGVSVVDELIRERRAEAACEEAKFQSEQKKHRPNRE